MKSSYGLGTIIVTSLLTSIIVACSVGAILFYFLSKPQLGPEIQGTKPGNAEPKPTRSKTAPTLSPSQITKVVWSRWAHQGPVSGGGRVVSTSFEFSNDLTAIKTYSVNYDADDANDKVTKSSGRIDREHFEKLADTIIKQDLLNEPDAAGRITESSNTIIIFYEGGEKTIQISNSVQKDSPEVEQLMTALTALISNLGWTEKS
jgi:hypothetical protein